MNPCAPFLLLSAALLAGCASAPRDRYYSMTPAQSAAPAAPTAPITRRVVIVPVSVPEAVHRVEIVVRRGEHRLEVLDHERWAALPSNEIAHATAQALEAALADPGTRVVVDSATMGSAAAQRVVIDVRRFDAVLGQSLAFDASWRVLDAKGKMLASGQTGVIEPAVGKADAGAEAIAAAAGRAVAQMAREIAAALPVSTAP